MSSVTNQPQRAGVGVLFGYPIAHSLSPLLHTTIYNALGLDWHFSLLESRDMPQFLEFIRDPRCFGARPTFPPLAARMLTQIQVRR
jgi:quinate dehydrogenase